MRVRQRALDARPLDRVDKAALPLFAATMLLEHAVLRRRAATDRRAFDDLDDADDVALSGAHRPGDPLLTVGYDRRDTVASLAMLAGSITVGFAFATTLSRADRALFRRRLTNIGSHRHALASAMVLWDLLYYWDHRFMHEIRLLWANHVSHHSSRRYNLSTALRQPWSSPLTAWVFAPMPLLGYRNATTMKAAKLNLLYQYWIHTEAIDRLPRPIEAVFNTPSHHRVHHGANTQYLDRNYGGILIIWDRLFRTFEPELRRVKYGLTTNIDTHNPLRIAYHEMAAMIGDVRRAPTWALRLGAVFGRPGWTPVR